MSKESKNEKLMDQNLSRNAINVRELVVDERNTRRVLRFGSWFPEIRNSMPLEDQAGLRNWETHAGVNFDVIFLLLQTEKNVQLFSTIEVYIVIFFTIIDQPTLLPVSVKNVSQVELFYVQKGTENWSKISCYSMLFWMLISVFCWSNFKYLLRLLNMQTMKNNLRHKNFKFFSINFIVFFWYFNKLSFRLYRHKMLFLDHFFLHFDNLTDKAFSCVRLNFTKFLDWQGKFEERKKSWNYKILSFKFKTEEEKKYSLSSYVTYQKS